MAGTALADVAPRRAYGTVVVVGGGCYGSYYVRQLQRATARRALHIDRLIVVDRDAQCAASRPRAGDSSALRPELHVGAWDEFFDSYLRTCGDADAIVPSPLMPHLFLHWLARRVGERQPGRRVDVLAPGALDGIPWQREAPLARYVSFAEWMCPVNCIEPARCPHTRGERSWSLPVTLRRAPARAGVAGSAPPPWDAAALLHCTHRAYGVGMIDVADVLAADALVAGAAARGTARVLVGSVSHCHGALGILAVA